MTSLAGRVVVVTGASRGIGRAVAHGFHASGAHVMRLARSFQPARSERRRDLPCDHTDAASVERAVSQILADHDPPSVLVNNAGGFLLRELHATTVDEFRSQMETNLVGPFAVLRALLPTLLQQRGHVVTIGSVADHQPFPGNAAYGASKTGLRALHEVLAVEYQGRLRATLVSPGPTDTAAWDAVDPDTRDDLPNRAQMMRAEDVADAVLFAVTRPITVNVQLIRLSPSGLA